MRAFTQALPVSLILNSCDFDQRFKGFPYTYKWFCWHVWTCGHKSWFFYVLKMLKKFFYCFPCVYLEAFPIKAAEFLVWVLYKISTNTLIWFVASTPNIGATNDIKLDAHPLSVSNCTASTTVPSVTPSASNYNTLAASSQPSNARYELRAILRELRWVVDSIDIRYHTCDNIIASVALSSNPSVSSHMAQFCHICHSVSTG